MTGLIEPSVGVYEIRHGATANLTAWWHRVHDRIDRYAAELGIEPPVVAEGTVAAYNAMVSLRDARYRPLSLAATSGAASAARRTFSPPITLSLARRAGPTTPQT